MVWFMKYNFTFISSTTRIQQRIHQRDDQSEAFLHHYISPQAKNLKSNKQLPNKQPQTR